MKWQMVMVTIFGVMTCSWAVAGEDSHSFWPEDREIWPDTSEGVKTLDSHQNHSGLICTAQIGESSYFGASIDQLRTRIKVDKNRTIWIKKNINQEVYAEIVRPATEKEAKRAGDSPYAHLISIDSTSSPFVEFANGVTLGEYTITCKN